MFVIIVDRGNATKISPICYSEIKRAI